MTAVPFGRAESEVSQLRNKIDFLWNIEMALVLAAMIFVGINFIPGALIAGGLAAAIQAYLTLSLQPRYGELRNEEATQPFLRVN